MGSNELNTCIDYITCNYEFSSAKFGFIILINRKVFQLLFN